jgi:bla regulator protein blaR1
MILYIVKSILCSGLFIGTYYFFLEKEKIHRFKRWYLLATLILTLIIPLITLEIARPKTIAPKYVSEVIQISEGVISPPAELTRDFKSDSGFNSQLIYILLYAAVTIIFLFRFSTNLLVTLSFIRGKKTVLYHHAMIITDDSVAVPFSFLNYIFVNHQDAQNSQILMHELTHTRQKHTWDILFIELLQCFMWFNPVLFLYKKAIRLNHEFLADERVIRNHSIVEYQNILLQKSQSHSPLSVLTSSLNYSITKKRFIMMSRANNQTRSMIRVIFSSLVVCLAICFLSEKVYGQNDPIPPAVIIQDTTQATTEMISEFDTLIGKYTYRKEKAPGQIVTWFNTTGITDSEKIRMQEIYKVMTVEQRTKYPAHITVIFAPFPLPKKNPPTAQELAAYSDAAVYGIWLDGKRIANTELAKYQPTDIAHVFKTRLLKNAAHYGQYKFHLDLMTQDYFEKTYPPKFK